MAWLTRSGSLAYSSGNNHVPWIFSRIPASGVTGSCEPDVGAGNWTQVPWRKSFQMVKLTAGVCSCLTPQIETPLGTLWGGRVSWRHQHTLASHRDGRCVGGLLCTTLNLLFSATLPLKPWLARGSLSGYCCWHSCVQIMMSIVDSPEPTSRGVCRICLLACETLSAIYSLAGQSNNS